MSQSTTPAAPGPAPGTISREQRRALLNHHMSIIRTANQAVELARAPLKVAQDNLTARIDEARADLGKKKYTRKRLLSYLEDLGARLRNILAEEEQRYQDRQDLGLPVHGEQLSLTLAGTETPEEAKDELAHEAEGYLRGRRGDMHAIVDGDPPRFHPVILKGFAKGQDETGKLVAEGMALRQRRAEPDPAATPAALNEPEPTIADERAAERRQTRAAKESLEKLFGGDDFEASEGELAGQSTRKAVQGARETPAQAA